MNLTETAAPVEVLWTLVGFVAVLVHIRLVHLMATVIKDLRAANRNGALLLTAWTRLVIKVVLLWVQINATVLGLVAMTLPPSNPSRPQPPALVLISSGFVVNELLLAALGIWMVYRWSLLDRYFLAHEHAILVAATESIEHIEVTGDDSNVRIRKVEERIAGSEQREMARDQRETVRDGLQHEAER